MYEIIYTTQAQKDAKKLAKSARLKSSCEKLLDILQQDPYQPPYEKLRGDLDKYISRRINLQHRLVYRVYEKEKIIKILRMWTHYE
jgi:toxin YoeB